MGQRLMIHPTSVTNIIDRLEQQGLVRRLPHPTDGRTTLAEITDEGRSLAKRATRPSTRWPSAWTGSARTTSAT